MMARADLHRLGRGGGGRRIRRILVGALLVILVAGLAVGGYVASLLAAGPMELAPVARMAEEVISEAVGGGRRTVIERAELSADLTDGLGVRLAGITVGDEASGLAVRIPQATIGLRFFPLLFGDIRPASLRLDGAQILVDLPTLDQVHAVRDAGGAPTVDGAPAQAGSPAAPAPAGAGDPPARPAEVVPPRGVDLLKARLESLEHALDRNLRFIREQGLESIATSGGEIVLVRRGLDGNPVRVTIPEVDIAANFLTDSGDIDMSFAATGEVGRWTMRLRHLTGADGRSRRLSFEAADVTLRDLFGPHDPDLKAEMPLYPQVSADLDEAGRLQSARLDMRLGAGLVRFGTAPVDEVAVDEGKLVVSWDVAAHRFGIERAGLQIGPSEIWLKGGVVAPKAGEAQVWTYEIVHDNGRVAPRDVGGTPVELLGLAMRGSFDGIRKALKIDDLQVHFTGGALRSIGHLDLLPEHPLLTINTVFTPAETEIVKRIWPHFIAPGARQWFIGHVRAGRISDGLIRLQVPLFEEPENFPEHAVALSARFEGGEVATFGDLPPVRDAAGTFLFEKRRFETVVERGTVMTEHSRKPTLAHLRLEIPHALQKSPPGSIDLRLTGDNVALGEVVDAEPLKLLDQAGVKVEGLAGTGEVKGRADMVFGPDLALDKVEFRFEALLAGFGSPSPILGRRFQDANLKVVVDQRGTAVTGKARIDGLPTDVDLFEPREGSKAAERRDFGMVVDDAARTRMGLDLAGMVSGPIKLEIGQAPAGEASRRITADLTQARLMIPQFGWTKGAGVPAKSVLDITEDARGQSRVDNFSIESEGLQVRGSLQLDKEKRLVSADLTRFQLRRGDDARLKLQRSGDGVVNVTFEAGSFDLRSLLQSIKKQDGPDIDPKKQSDMNVKVRAARLIGFNDVTLTDVVIDTQVRGQVIGRLQLSGRAPGGRSVEIAIRPENGKRNVTMVSDDAGAVLGFLDVYERLRAGRLQLAASLSGPGTANGSIRIVDFRLLPPRNERVAAPRTTNDGLREVAVRDVPISDDATFDRFEVRFAMRRGVITLTEGIAKGPATGATMSGQIDLTNQKLNIAGTFIPLYGLNNLVSRIPLFGEIVGAGKNEGLVGVTFRVLGNVDNPALQYNPISAIAPGIFRKIFEYRVDSSPTSGAPASSVPR